MRKKPKREGREVTFIAGLATWGGGGANGGKTVWFSLLIFIPCSLLH
jgi:hypothetical protein